VSLNAAANELWVTLNAPVQNAVSIQIDGPPATTSLVYLPLVDNPR
jgi:hypothetical protein